MQDRCKSLRSKKAKLAFLATVNNRTKKLAPLINMWAAMNLPDKVIRARTEALLSSYGCSTNSGNKPYRAVVTGMEELLKQTMYKPYVTDEVRAIIKSELILLEKLERQLDPYYDLNKGMNFGVKNNEKT